MTGIMLWHFFKSSYVNIACHILMKNSYNVQKIGESKRVLINLNTYMVKFSYQYICKLNNHYSNPHFICYVTNIL